MNIIKKLLIKSKMVNAKPHEKAELGQGAWGRQSATAKPRASITAKVIRKDGTIEDLGRLK